MQNSLITVYPQSIEQVSKYKDIYGISHMISLQELSGLSVKNLIKRIFTMPGKWIFLCNDENEESFVSVVMMIFLFSKSFKIEVIKNQKIYKYSKISSIFSLFKFIFSHINAFFVMFKLHFFATLQKKKKSTYQILNKSILYAKSNFWVSVKAGGSVGHVQGVISGFSRFGYRLTFAGLDKNVLADDHLPIESLTMTAIKPELNCLIFDDFFYNQLEKIKIPNFGFVYHRMALNSIAALRYAKKHKLPFVLEYNGSEVWVQRNWGKRLFFEKFAQKLEDTNLRLADAIVTISKPLEEELLLKGVPKEKIVVYPNCVDVHKYDPSKFKTSDLSDLRASLDLRDDENVFTFIGTFGKWHGVDFMVQAIAELYSINEALFRNIKFLLIGDGFMMKRVKEIIDGNPISKKLFVFSGLIEQDSAIAYLAMSDAFLSPHIPQADGSKFFGSPTKLFEYMAMQKPIIASNLDQQGEILMDLKVSKEVKSVCLFEPGNKDAFKDQLKYCIENYGDVLEDAKKHRDYVKEKYTWDIHVSKIIEKINELGE
jgi:glycosyltransferase involved in cell wall biosynthesis